MTLKEMSKIAEELGYSGPMIQLAPGILQARKKKALVFLVFLVAVQTKDGDARISKVVGIYTLESVEYYGKGGD